MRILLTHHVGLLAVLLSCLALTIAAAQKPESFSVRIRGDASHVHRVIPFPVEEVWAALPRAYRDLGYSGGRSAREDERIYLTPSLTIRGRLYRDELNSDYLDCGRTSAGEPAADVYAVQFAIITRLTPQGDSTVAEVVIDGTARDRGQSSNSVFCTGSGKIEAALLDGLQALVNARH